MLTIGTMSSTTRDSSGLHFNSIINYVIALYYYSPLVPVMLIKYWSKFNGNY